ncbi:phage antirepressor KilAC domain-containing protein, partial [Clostridioides difficile]
MDNGFYINNIKGKGYTHSETIDITRSDGMTDVKMTTKWTQKGRLFL